MGREVAVVLFTDLVGSTELRTRLGEEPAEALRRTHDRLLTQAVEANNGRVVKGLGDGIMATFAGASDAVAAAVAIQQTVDRYNRSAKAVAPTEVRVGISAGDVTTEDDDVHGTPVIEAARLCAVAAGGDILASEVVRWLARSSAAAAFTPVGNLELKGLPDAVPAVRVGWEPMASSPVPLPALLTDVGRVFVGRETEVERLDQLWKEAAAGERRVALLAGEPGVGKTRLASELAAQVHEEGAMVLAGRCDEDLGVPYQPFVEALRHFVDHTPLEDLRERLGRYGGELTRLVPELAQRVADLPPPLNSDPETERYRLFDAVAAWLAAASADEPGLLVLDDLQWAAKPTLLLLRHIVRSPDAKRLLVVGTYRDTEISRDHPLVDLLADLRREGSLQRFALMGLDSSGVAAFMEQAAGHPLAEEDLALAQAIYEETEGNPFFVREVFRHLTESGLIQRREGRWATRVSVEEVGIPESVREVVGRRLSRLSDDANQTLRMAAVVGAEFALPVVQAAASLDEDVLIAALDEATRARLVIEAADGLHRYRFAHALVRETLYGELSAARRAALHRRVAEAIENVHAARLDDHLPALAHHWARASTPAAETARAVHYARRAGDRALAQLAHDEAAHYYRQGLELLQVGEGAIDEAQRLELLISLGEAQRRAGDPAHRHTLLDAARLANDSGDAHALGRAALANTRGALASAMASGDRERLAALRAALDLLGPGDSAIHARLLATYALELLPFGDRERRVSTSDEAVAMARRVGDPAALAHVLVARFFTTLAPQTLSERLAETEELLVTADRLADPMITARAWWLRCRAAMEGGDIDEAQRALTRVEAISAEIGQPTLSWQAAYAKAAFLLFGGHVDEAERLVLEAADLARSSGQPDAAMYNGIQLFGVRLEQGRLAEIQDFWSDLVDQNSQVRFLQAMFAFLLCECEQDEDAKSLLERLAAQRFADVPLDYAWELTLTCLAAVAARLGDRPSAEILHRLLAPYPDRIAGTLPLWTGSVSHYLGMVATTVGDFGDAEKHFAAAVFTHDRIGAPAWLARTRLEWARMLLTRQQHRDTEPARELLGQALTTARELGLGKVERDAVALLR